MNTISAQDILFDDFALLVRHIGRQQLMVTSVNANCDCASSPSLNANCDCVGNVSPVSDCDCISHPLTFRYDDLNSNQITPSAG